MPEMDGLELSRRVSADPLLAGVRLVLLTSNSEVDATDAARAGIEVRLTKPVRHSELYNRLVALRAPATAEAPAAPAAPARTRPTSADRGHLLVVEDNSLNQIVAKSLNQIVAKGTLTKLGYAVDVVANGLEAVAAVSDTAYTAVLMDCHMPEMDGFEATAEIRRREGATRHTPIIAMTASALSEDRDRCLAAGMDDFVSKPVNVDAVEAAVSRWSEREPTVAPVPRSNGGGPADGLPQADGERRDDDVLDPERLDVLRQLGPADGWGLLPPLVEAFLADGPTRFASLEQAVKGGDGAVLEQAAHQLKGAASNIGATGLAAVCGELEAIGRSRRSPARELLDQLTAELDRASRALADVVQVR